MLSDFFKLDTPFKEFDKKNLEEHFKVSKDLRSVLYRPDEFPSSIKYLKSVTFKNVSLSKTTIRKITFRACEFEDCLFIGTIFYNVEFHRCKFINCNFNKSIFNSCYINPNTIHFDKKYRSNAANVGVYTFQQLYENSSKLRQSDFEMSADFEFRRWKRWQLRYDQEQGKIKRCQLVLMQFTSLLYEYLTGFGYKPSRFIVTTFAFFTSISLLNMYLLPGGITYNDLLIDQMNFIDAIFYTYSLMTTIGFSTIIPETEIAKILAVLEALIGIGWLGIFTSLLVKKFLK